MRLIAVVEIPRISATEPQSALLRAAYQASRSGPVVLLLPPNASDVVDRELDALVASDRRVHGVVYGDLSDAAIWHSAGPNTLVVGSSPHARSVAESMGARCVDGPSAVAALQKIGGDAVNTAARRAARSPGMYTEARGAIIPRERGRQHQLRAS